MSDHGDIDIPQGAFVDHEFEVAGNRGWIRMWPGLEIAEFGFEGRIQVPAAIGFAREICTLPEWTPRFSRLFHLHPDALVTDVDMAMLQEAKAAMLAIHGEFYGDQPVRAANLAAFDHNRPMAMMWEFLNSDSPGFAVRFFREREEAIAWLRELDWVARA